MAPRKIEIRNAVDPVNKPVAQAEPPAKKPAGK